MQVRQLLNSVQNVLAGQLAGQLVGHFASLFDCYNYPRMQNFDVKKAVF